jgi:hypothetical protein
VIDLVLGGSVVARAKPTGAVRAPDLSQRRGRSDVWC